MKYIAVIIGVSLLVLLMTYNDFLEYKIENQGRSNIVTAAQLGDVKEADNRLNQSDNTIASLCNTLSMKRPRKSKNSIQTAKSCQCVIDELPLYLLAERADEFKELYEVRYIAYNKMERTTSEWVKEDLLKKYARKYDEMFAASGFSDREYGQGVLAVTKHVQTTCGLTHA